MFNRVGLECLSVRNDLNIVLVSDSRAPEHMGTFLHVQVLRHNEEKKRQCSAVAMNDYLYIEYILSVWTASMQLVRSAAVGCRYSRGINSALFFASGRTGGMKYLQSA